jgi:hypothetical protein
MLSVRILVLLQAGLDAWIKHYDEEKAQSRTNLLGKTAGQTFLVSMPPVNVSCNGKIQPQSAW